jgi:NADPH-dependent 2,4-dienoyl-CoA reductase/sulfur reductase-like enzyme
MPIVPMETRSVPNMLQSWRLVPHRMLFLPVYQVLPNMPDPFTPRLTPNEPEPEMDELLRLQDNKDKTLTIPRRIAVVGGGYGGVELAACLQH